MKKAEMEIQLLEFIKMLQFDEKAQRTYKKYQCDVKQFIDSISHDDEITKEDVMNYKQKMLESDYKPVTINSKIISVNKFLKYIELKDYTVRQIKIQRTSSLSEVMTPTDYKRLLRIAKRNGDEQLYLIMKILAQTGIRISELRYFTVENLDYYIKVSNKGKIRTIIVRQDLYREIKKYCRVNKITSGTIFEGKKKGQQIVESTIWRRMKKISGQARVKKSLVHAHSFRHLFAVMYLEQNNNNILELADILGHESLETTRIYTRSTDKLKRKKLESMKF